MADEESYNDASNVGVGEPKATGGMFVAPLGTEAPTDAATELGDDYKCLGYMNEDGVSQANSYDNEDIVAWGGDVVRNVSTSFSQELTFTAIETNKATMEYIYGEGNVECDSEGRVTHVTETSDDAVECVLVIEMVISSNRIQRKVFPRTKLKEIGDLTYQDGEPIGYEITAGVYPYDANKYVEDYYAEVA